MKNQAEYFCRRLLVVKAAAAESSCAGLRPEVAQISNKQRASSSVHCGDHFGEKTNRPRANQVNHCQLDAIKKTTTIFTVSRKSHRLLILLVIATLLSLVRTADSLKFSSIQIPSLVQRNTNFWLACQFELEQHNNSANGDQLYSVKWYKNNEEFYRLMLGSSGADQSGASSPPSPSQQQQYFAQAGVNVMMSASNATHVRLLNASLESEGMYACEISTQNLSTIRYEREVRVYVLPHSKLNIIGLRTRYSLGDQVDLICSSDFSRPEPALAWFVNGHRIRPDLHGRQLGFQLDSQPAKSKLNEPTLFRLNLGLKFKLTNSLLLWSSSLASQANSNSSTGSLSLSEPPSIASSQQQQQQHNQRQSNQSQSGRRGQQAATTIAQQQLSQDKPLVAGSLELRLQCKYRLTEISDVTFNELVASQAYGSSQAATAEVASSNSAGADNDDDDDDDDDDNNSNDASITALHRSENNENHASNANDDQSPVDRTTRNRKSQVATTSRPSGPSRQPEVRVTKSNGIQVNQGKCPATSWELVRALSGGGGAGRRVPPHPEQLSNCELGALALQPEDPLIVAAQTTRASKADSHGGQGRRRRRRRQLETTGGNGEQPISSSAGELISVNCSTISALLGDAADTGDDGSGDNNYFAADAGNWRRTKSARDGHHHHHHHYCSDVGARKRAAISGKHRATTTNEEPAAGLFLSSPLVAAASNSNQRLAATQSVIGRQTLARPQNGRQVAYLSLSSPAPPSAATVWAPQQAETRPATRGGDNTNLRPPDSADSALSIQTRSLQATQSLLLAPPLIEWFINNQEAPAWSASYSPPLPLVAPAASRRRSGPSAQNGAHAILAPDGSAGALNSNDGDVYVGHEEEEEELDSQGRQQPASDLARLTGGSSQPPSVDYKEYFANFDSRSNQQSLVLNLTLAKRHFMTPDSKLRLRCSSTQAQVLLADSASVFILTVPPNANAGVQSAGHSGGLQTKHQASKQLWNSNSQIGGKHHYNQQLLHSGSQARSTSSGSTSIIRDYDWHYQLLLAAAVQAIAVATIARLANNHREEFTRQH